MSALPRTLLLTLLIGALVAPAATAQKYEGTIKLGGIWLDETGNRAVMQETYNLFDGFSVNQLRLTGNPSPKHSFALNLQEINLDSRKGEFVYRMPGRLRFNTRYNQWRQLFNPDGSIASNRHDWKAGLKIETGKDGQILASYNNIRKTGGRIGYPVGTMSFLGDSYDYTLQTGLIEAGYNPGRYGVALTYNFADYNNRLSSVDDRLGQLISLRAHGPCRFWKDKFTHMLRGSLGKQELKESGLNLTLYDLQYTAVIRPQTNWQFKYNFYGRRIDDEGTALETDNIENNFALTYYHNYGSVYGGYGYEMNDNELNLTNYHKFLLGASGNYEKKLRAQIEYGNRNKEDVGQLTLLRDMESSRFKASLRYQATDDLYLGGKVSLRDRKFTQINVEASGELYNAYAGYEYPQWGSLMADYSYSLDDYDNYYANFTAGASIVTGRAQFDRIKNLMLAGGGTYLRVKEDLDIEKSIFFLEGRYTIKAKYHVELKYNIYNYDDFIVTGLVYDKFYTGHAVWFNLAYDFRKE